MCIHSVPASPEFLGTSSECVAFKYNAFQASLGFTNVASYKDSNETLGVPLLSYQPCTQVFLEL
jgi:hypothetical protein